MKKTVKVHMLPTQEDSHLSIIRGSRLHYYRKLLNVSPDRAPQHLYFTSDEEIKEGDWFIDDSTDITRIQQCKTIPSKDLQEEVKCRKIIATTDESLKTKESCIQCDGTGETTFSGTYTTQKVCSVCEGRKYITTKLLSKIPKQFIEDYSKAGGIDEVLLDYENDSYLHTSGMPFGSNIKSAVRTDLANCVITYTAEPKLYTREDVEKLCVKAYDTGAYFRLWLDKISIGLGEGKTTEEIHSKYGLINWIKENLK